MSIELEVSGIEARICQEFAGRQQVGIKKYGTTVEDNPLEPIQWLQHFREELMDGLVYATKLQQKLEAMGDDLK